MIGVRRSVFAAMSALSFALTLGASTGLCQTRQITGHVLAAADSAPLSGVAVEALGQNAETTTDSAGRFALKTSPGDVRLGVHRIGIAPDTVLVPRGQDSATVFARAAAVTLDTIGISAVVAPARARFDTLAQPSIITLAPREIARTPGLFDPDVVRAVQLLPGIVARNDYSAGYNVRGGESDQNLVLLDGVTFFNPSHAGGLFSTFDANAIDRADLMTGSFPARYPGRLSSVLDVAVRSGSSERVHGSGSVSLLSAKMLVEGPAGPASFLLSARRSYADQVVKTFTSSTLPYHFTDLTGKVRLPTPGAGQLMLTGYWGKDALATNLVPADSVQQPIDLDFGWGNHLLGLHWHQPIGHGAFDQRLSWSAFSSALDLKPDLARYHNVAQLLNAQSSLSLKPGASHDVNLGVDVERYRMSYDVGTPALGNAYGYDARYHPAVFGAFVDEQWRPLKWLLFHAGTRLEHVTGASFTGLSPSAALKVFLSANQALTGSVGRYHQAIQSLRDQEIPISIYEFWVGAGPWVPVAEADHLVLGYERWFGAHQFTVEAFRKTFRHLITPNPGFALRDPSNQFQETSGDAWGFDLLLRRHAHKVNGWIAWSFVKATRRSAGVEYPPAHDRRHTVNIVVQAPGPLHSELGVRWGFGSPLPYTAVVGQWQHRTYSPTQNNLLNFEGPVEAVGGPINGARFPPYSRMDAGLHWHAERWGIRWEPYVEVVNLYDRQNVFTYFFAPKLYATTMTEVYQLPFLASFGLDFSW